MNNEFKTIGTTMVIELTDGKKEVERYILTIPEDSPFDTITRMELFQKEADKLGLSIKLI
jgi:hypothetical protein